MMQNNFKQRILKYKIGLMSFNKDQIQSLKNYKLKQDSTKLIHKLQILGINSKIRLKLRIQKMKFRKLKAKLQKLMNFNHNLN